jgi:hypothetical protein
MKNKSIFLLYILFMLIFSVFTYLFVDQNLLYMHSLYTGFYIGNRSVISFFYVFFVLGFFTFYLFFLKQRLSFNLFKKLALISVACLVFSYPAIISYDIFNYFSTAKVTFFYKENPYLVMPNEFINDPMLLFTRATNKYALYGPSWIVLSGIPFVLGFNNFIAQLLLFKVLAAMFYLGIIYVIRKITNNISKLVFFALNPLILVETLVSGHNDIAMMFFALSSIFLLKKNKLFFAFVLLAASILIKFATIFLLPAFVYTVYLKVRSKTIDWNKVYLYSAALMFVVFLLSPIREEIYPWYAIWFILFVALLEGHKTIKTLTVAVSFGLMLSYLPYMFSGTYLFPTPQVKLLLITIPVLFTVIYETYNRHTKSN